MPAFFFSDTRNRDLAAEGLVLAEGPYLVERLLRSTLTPLWVACLPDLETRYQGLAAGRCPVHPMPREAMADVAGYPFHRGALAAARRPVAAPASELIEPAGPRVLVICPDLNDDANVGLVLRSALALGAAGALLGPRCADPWSRRALRLSMGAVFSLPFSGCGAPAETAEALRSAGYTIVGTANRPDATALPALRPPRRVAVLIGNETSGLETGWLTECSTLVRIPMRVGVDSVNAAVAAGIVLYALGPGARGDLPRPGD